MHHNFKKCLSCFLQFSTFSALMLGISLLLGNLLFQSDARSASADTSPKTVYTVIIDAGHGGRDGGASADDDGTLEKDLNLAVAKKLEALLKTANVRVVMTREHDVELASPDSDHKKRDDLNARLAIAEEAENAIFVSIHMNKFPVAKYSGLQVYYSPNHEKSSALAERIQSDAAAWSTGNARRPKAADESIYLLHHMEIPAVLVECGFLSNYEEKELLKTDAYQKKLAVSIYASILQYLSTNE